MGVSYLEPEMTKEDYNKFVKSLVEDYPYPPEYTGTGTRTMVVSPHWAAMPREPFITGAPKTPKHRNHIVGDLVQEGYWVKATGSRVTKSGWTKESDWDYVVYDPDNILLKELQEDKNWSKDSSGNGDPGIDFNSFRNGQTNLILVSTENIWKNYIIATNLIKSLNCETKKERIEIFDSVFGKDRNLQAVEF